MSRASTGRPAGWTSSRSRAERARQVADALRQQITTGRYPNGVLPGEHALGAEFDASRNAVREALRLLRAEGLITRKRGVGTTVVRPKYGHGLDRLAGLAETLTGYGAVTNEVRVAERVSAPSPAVTERLGMAPGSDVFYIERLRRLDGEPLSLDSTYLPFDIGAGLCVQDLADNDLFTLIEAVAGIPLGCAEVTVHAVTADPDTAALLEIPAGAAIFAIDRLTRLADGRPVDTESLHIRADRLALDATLHRGTHQVHD